MKTIKTIFMLLIFMALISANAYSQNDEAQNILEGEKITDNNTLKTYVIERDIPEAGTFSPEQLKEISVTSCGVLDQMGSENIQWLHSYVTENKIYCIYKARNKELLKEHAEKGGFPANSISELSTIISPETAK